MSDELAKKLDRMKKEHEQMRDKLRDLKAKGVHIQGYPDGFDIDDMIEREQTAIDNLDGAIDLLTR